MRVVQAQPLRMGQDRRAARRIGSQAGCFTRDPPGRRQAQEANLGRIDQAGIEEAEAGGTVAVGDATIDGRQIVSVDVLGRNGV